MQWWPSVFLHGHRLRYRSIYRKDAENGQCKSDIVIRFLKTSDPRYDIFCKHSAETAAVTFAEGSGDNARVAIAVKDSIDFLGTNWNRNLLVKIMTHEIGHALGLGHSTVLGAIMSPDVALVSETLSRDDITNVQAIYPPLKSIITLPVGDTVDNHQLALMPNLTDTKDIFLIKTANTDTGNVEVHSLTAASDYTSYHVQAGTPVSQADAYKYQFVLAYNRDLFCIKTMATGKLDRRQQLPGLVCDGTHPHADGASPEMAFPACREQ